MKRILFISLLLGFLTTHAQTDFEGWVYYKSNPDKSGDGSDNKTDSVEITIGFTRGRILINTGIRKNQEALLIVFDSAKIYSLNRQDKTYYSRKLRTKKPIPPAQPLQIAGYTATPLVLEGNGLSFFGPMNATFWLADSLFYKLPDNFMANQELMMVQQGRILMRGEFESNYRQDLYEEPGEDSLLNKDNDKFIIQAYKVVPGNIRAEDFTIPADYTTAAPDVMVETVSITDTAFKPEPPPPAPKKAPAASKKPATKGKPTTKPPIRKEN